MIDLTEKEMKSLSGGGISLGLGAVLVMGAVFIVGLVDGIVRPLKCH